MAKTLIVDDSSYTRMMLKSILIELGHTVIEADSAKAAMESYKIENPDIVFMDVILDDVDGIEAAAMIRETDPDAKVIMCSAQRHDALVEKAEAAGALMYLTKPFDRSKIETAIKSVLQNKK